MNQKKKILVTGANGQLGQSLQAMSNEKYDFVFASRKDLDITDVNSLKNRFKKYSFDHCLNFAAYTQVDQAEIEPEKAFLINTEAVGKLAEICNKNHCTFFHISTDYVFDGNKKLPYKETDSANPINIYGQSKWEGEKKIIKNTDRYYIIRTSWLFSDKGNNFYKTILRLVMERDKLSIVSDQTGSPTLTYDLLDFIFWLIEHKPDYGIYHFSNEGQTTWFEFAKKIIEGKKLKTQIIPVSTEEFNRQAKRPFYSVLDKSKIKKLSYFPHQWEEALDLLKRKEYGNY